jgi:hypothetical protein
MPVFQIGLEDGRSLRIEADDQESALAGAQHFLGNNTSAPEPSGIAAGLSHGAEDVSNGLAQTAKEYLGVGPGASQPTDPDYVPAEVINGFNPLKWNYSQLPQKVAENVPGLAETAAAAMAGSKVGALAGIRGRLLGGLAGAAGSIWANNAGNSAKADAVRRTGDQNAEPNAGDLTRAGLVEAASALAQAAGPMRFIPSAGKAATAVGAAGLKAAARRMMETSAIAGASGAASDAVSQIGNTIGTDKGVSFDPSRTADAAIGNAGAAALMGAPRAVVDAYSALRQRGFGGNNADATSAYFQRLINNAGDKGLGNAKQDYAAHENTVAGLKKELGQVRTDGLDQDTANVLSLAKGNHPLTEDHVKQIESVDPQAGFLARQLYVAQQAEKFGSYDNANKAWAGGLSGFADKYAIGPLKRHWVFGASGLAAGHPLASSYAIPTLAGATGAYLSARAIDNLTGLRSPAKGLAERYVDTNVPTRLPDPPQPTPPLAPDNTQGPWGPRLQPSTSVPQVTPVTPKPDISPVALSMLKQKLKTSLPEEAPAPEPVKPEFNPVALKMLNAKLKRGLPPEEPASPPETLNGDVQASQQPASQFYRPLDPSEMMFGGKALEMSPAQIGRAIAEKRMAGKPEDVVLRYANSTADTHAERRAIVQDVIARHPSDVLSLMDLMHQLHERGTADQAKSAVNHYAQTISPAAAADLLSGFNDEAVKRIWATSAEKKAARRKANQGRT